MLYTYTSLDDYDAMFEARHGTGAVDSSLVTTEGMVSTTFPMTLPPQAEPVSISVSNKDPMTRQIPTYTASSATPFSSQPDQTQLGEEYQPQMEENIVSPVGVGHILGEGDAVFTDMTETMLTAFDKQMAQPEKVWRSVSSSVNTLHDPNPMPVLSKSRQGTPVTRAPQPLQSPIPTHEPKKLPFPPLTGDVYPDLYLPISENYNISDKFMGILIVFQQIITL